VNDLLFDSEREVRVETHHLLRDSSSRELLSKVLGGIVGEKYWEMLLLGSVADLQSKLRHRRQRMVVPIWSDDHVQFLLPLRLSREDNGCVLLLVVEAAVAPYYGVADYRAVSIITREEGYSRARLVDVPDSDWLVEVFGPNISTGSGGSSTTTTSPTSTTSSPSARMGFIRPSSSCSSLLLPTTSSTTTSPFSSSSPTTHTFERYFEDLVSH